MKTLTKLRHYGIAALLLCALQTPAKAGEITHWCGMNQDRTCTDWIPVHMPSKTVHYTIDPDMPQRKFLMNQIENFEAGTSFNYVFDGFNKINDTDHQGIYFYYSKSGDALSGELGVTDINHTVTEFEDHAEIGFATVRMNKIAFSLAKWKTQAALKHELHTTVIHELMHALGIAHNSNPASIMYGDYNASKVILKSDMDTLNDLYSGDSARTVSLNEGGLN